MLDMGLVDKLNEVYKFKIKQINGNALSIKSSMDEWILEMNPKLHALHKNIQLWHNNWKRNRGKFHRQREFFDLQYAFQSIYEHDTKYLRDYGTSYETKKLFEKLI